jgi:hypothetical protein
MSERIKNHLDRVVRGSLEEKLNALLEAEADRPRHLRRRHDDGDSCVNVSGQAWPRTRLKLLRRLRKPGNPMA